MISSQSSCHFTPFFCETISCTHICAEHPLLIAVMQSHANEGPPLSAEKGPRGGGEFHTWSLAQGGQRFDGYSVGLGGADDGLPSLSCIPC
jgi:hypothetical protein